MTSMQRMVTLVLAAFCALPAAGGDRYVVSLPAELIDQPVSGRLMLFFITEHDGRWSRRAPIEGPFLEAPQPIASIAVEKLAPGGSVTLDDARAVSWPERLDGLSGPVRVQAILDRDSTERCHRDGPGNLYSEPVAATLDDERDDRVELRLSNVVPEPQQLESDSPHLVFVEVRSELLSSFYGRDVFHRAGVALPKGYLDPARARHRWGAIYEIPGFGGRTESAITWSMVHEQPGSQAVAPQAVVIVLDPESPLGHHGFVDSPNHGPRGTALVKELIPALEQRFRLVAKPEARVVTGHSSGGWSSLWLALHHPEVFGACWSSAPDPVDFRAFQRTNLYEDESVYVADDGAETPSMRRLTGPTEETVVLTVRQEALMEHAMDPAGGSGEQWDAWEAMFSPKDAATGMPKPMYDARTGKIDRTVVEHWKRFDISRLVRDDWPRYGPILTQRVRLACGTLDSFYLNGAVELLSAAVQEKRGAEESGPGYIFMREHATHGNLPNYMFARWNDEMRKHLDAHGLSEGVGP